jgi:hypothetical protein
MSSLGIASFFAEHPPVAATRLKSTAAAAASDPVKRI